MPSIDATALKILGPYLDLGAKVGTLVQQIAPAQIATLRITYWGKIVDLDANSVTRFDPARAGCAASAAKGSISSTPPCWLERLGVKLEVIKSTDDVDYNRAESPSKAIAADGSAALRRGHADREDRQAARRRDQPARSGGGGRRQAPAHRKSRRARHDRLRRHAPGPRRRKHRQHVAQPPAAGGDALMVINLDSEPSDSVRRELKSHRAIKLASSCSCNRRHAPAAPHRRRGRVSVWGSLPFGYLVARAKGVKHLRGWQQGVRARPTCGACWATARVTS